MAVSDDEFIDDASDEEVRQSGRRGADASSAPARAGRKTKDSNFEVTRTWENVEEGADGTITSTVEGMREAEKRKRLLKDTTPLQRGIIRHLIVIIDMSAAMAEKDLRPTRYLLSIRYATEFVLEFFEQNPISQMGIVGMRDGIAIRVSDMSGNPTEHITALQKIRPQEPKGNPSLENALEMARASLFHAPSHGTREILLVFGALHTTDPGDIHATISSLVEDKIFARVISLAAQLAICAELVTKTNNGDGTGYSVVLHEQHFRELFMASTTPPITHANSQTATSTGSSSLLMMGFPSRTVSMYPTLCACHSVPSRTGYLCSRCSTKVCSLPSECPTCALTLILSTHLARSYHHLFPLVNWREVRWPQAYRSSACSGCGKGFPAVPPREDWVIRRDDGGRVVTMSGRYECPSCRRHFCIDCDLFAHEVVHNCPGCQSGYAQTQAQLEAPNDGVGREQNGHANGLAAGMATQVDAA